MTSVPSEPPPPRIGKFVLFDIEGQRYALPLEDIVEVIWMVALTPTPAHHDHIEGVINLRGTILPILNVRRRLQAPPATYGLNHRILVVRTAGHTLGFIVDAVAQVEEFGVDQIEPPREFDQSLSFVTGMIKLPTQIVFCIDLRRLLSEGEIMSASQLSTQLSDGTAAAAASAGAP